MNLLVTFLVTSWNKIQTPKKEEQNACQVAMSNEFMAIEVNGIGKAC